MLGVCAALVDLDGDILLSQRGPAQSFPGMWEFPGGKLEAGETPERALCRELREELGIEIESSCLAPLTFASYGYADFHLLMTLFVCRVWEGEPVGCEGQALCWVPPVRLTACVMPGASHALAALVRDFLEGGHGATPAPEPRTGPG